MKESEGYFVVSSEDEHCYVRCVCQTSYDAPELSIGPAWVTRCPDCGRGYRTKLVIYVYNPGENDPECLNEDEWIKQIEDSKKQLGISKEKSDGT